MSRPSRQLRYLIAALVVSLLAGSGVFPSAAGAGVAAPAPPPAPVEAAPELGGRLFSTGARVEVQVLPASAGFTSELWLFEPGPERRLATNRDVGLVVDLGTFPSGVELVFGIKVLNTGQTFKMGPGDRNPDGIPHAVVDFLEPGRAHVGFEDLLGGGDRDYNDNMFEFRGGIVEEPPSGPVADAGPDQTVDEGAVVTLDATGSSDPDSQNLTYAWALAGHVGPPITLSSSTSATPTFQSVDDGSYTFTLTVSDGSTTGSDEVVITVRNRVPVLSAQADPAYAGGVALVTTSFTDAGILDTHAGTLLWGDGSAAEAVPVSAQGTGWGTLVASHVYANPGSYTVKVTITDDDGGAASTTVAGLQVIVPVALWANSSGTDAAMESTSGIVNVVGLTHTNDDLRIRGGAKTFTGPTEYVRTLDVGGAGATFAPPAVRTGIKPFPFRFPIAHYRPAGRAAIEAGPAYHNMSASCGSDGFWHVVGSTLASGIYYASCGVKLNGSPLGGTITVAAEGEIHVSGSGAFFDPYIDGLLFVSYSTSTSAIKVDASNSTFFGYSFAERGRIVLTGSGDKFYCGILADRIDIAAQNLRVEGSGCTRPARTIAPPTLVPALGVEVTVDRTDTLPGQALVHTATVTNGGATLVVPGVIGVENLGTAAVTVTGHTLGLEYLSATDHAWHPLPGATTITVRPNAIGGVAYPSGTERIDGTVVQPGALASWGYAAVVRLTAAEVGFLLDPTKVSAVRNSSTFTMSPATVPVRRLFRFGDDFAAQLRSLGADATNVAVTIIPPAGDPRVFSATTTPALGTLSPGELVDVSMTSNAPAPAARAADESDAAYLARLASFDGTLLVGTAFARGTATIGPVLAPADLATTTRHLPVVGLDKTGPASIEAGATAQYGLGLVNTGSAEARQVVLTDVVSGAGARPVTGAPTTLAPAATATAAASYPVPANATQSIVNTGTVGWSDAAGNAYGPLNDALTTIVIAPRKLAVIKTDVSTGGSGGDPTITYEVAVTNLGDQPVSGVVVTDSPDALTTLVVGSVTTTAGSVTTGNTSGDTTVAVDLGTLAGRTTVVVSFDAAVGFVPEGVSTVSNQATVTSVELPPIVSDDPGQPGATDPTLTPVGPTAGGGGGGGGGGEARPVIGAPTPADGTIVTEPLTISATIAPPEGQAVASWRISASLAGATGDTVLATGSGGAADEPVTASAAFDPTALANGTYLITIRSTASGGGIQTSTTSLVVDGNLKLGRFVTTYQDLSVGVAGLPMQVLRTYDSFDTSVGDFGVGWTVGLANFRVAVNKPLGYGGWVQETFGCGFIFCQTRYHSTTPHIVTVVWPDGHQEIFDLTPANGSTFFAPATAVGFTGRPRTTSTLQADGDTSLSYFGDGNLYGGGFGSGGVYDPQRFRLTARDGTVYLLDRTSGLVSATDRNGDTLTVTASGITSSRGPSITFERDPLGRISTITGPEDEKLVYIYDPAGDLRTVTDPNDRVVTYEYDAHRLRVTKDPLGRPFQTLTYEDGRLATVTDALGNETTVDVDPDARTETITDAAGRLTTISTLDPRGNVVERRELYDGRTAVTTFAYDAFDNVTRRTDPNGHDWTAIYDEKDLRFFTDPTGQTVEVRYDEFGFPIRWIQPGGGETVYDWNDAGQLESITDALGEAETYGYDPDGNRQSTTDREDNTWAYTYFPGGLLETSTDPLEHVTRYTYDDSGRLLTETDPTGRVTASTWWPDGSLRTRTAPGSLVTSYTYDELGLLKTKTDAAGKTTTYQYDAAGRVRKEIDPLSKETLYSFDAAGRLETSTAPDGGATTNAYDGAGRLASVTDPIGRVTRYRYDLAGRLVELENPATGVTEYEYDDAGRQVLVRDPLGHPTTRTYDDDGNVATVTDPLDHTTRYDYDLAGRLSRITDAASGITRFGHDDNGKVTTTTNPENETTTSVFDPAGRLELITDALGHATTYGYDDAGRPTTTTDALGHTTTNAYDPAGRIGTTTTASGIVTTYTYDPRGMIASVRNQLGHTTTYTYDDAGRLATERDPRTFTTTYTYDAAGRTKTIKDPKNAVVTLGYDLAGQQTSITDPRGKIWRATYDLLGGVKTTTDPLGRGTVLEYNDAGQLIEQTDARGVVVGYDYDEAGNLSHVTSAPLLSIGYGYDALNRRTSTGGALGPTTWSYDGAGRLTSVAAPAGTIGYTYDDAGRRATMTLPSGSVTYGYSDDDRLSSLSGPAGAFSFSYLADGRPQTVVRPNGVTTTDGYDAAGRLTSVTHRNGPSTLAAFSYTLDASGNRTSMTSAAGTEGYTINELNQLTRVTLPGATIDYTYDPAGNRATRATGGATTTYTYDDASQLTAVGAVAYTYDAAGHRLSGGGATFTWDQLGRLASATSGGATTTYASDGEGRRVASTTGGATTPYLWDVAGAVDQLVGSGSSSYLHAAGLALSEASAGSIAYPLADALGSVRAVTNAAGAVTGSAAYDAFGATTAQTGTASRFGFTGEMSDPAGIYLRARTFDPVTGQFLSVDPVRPGAPGVVGYNPYSYAASNPTTWTDPSGMFLAESALLQGQAVRTAPPAIAVGVTIRYVFLRMALMLLYAGTACLLVCDALLPPITIGDPPITGTNDVNVDELQRALQRAGRVEITRTVAETIAATCVASKVAALVGPVGDVCSGRRMPVFFTAGDVLAPTLHDLAAIVTEGKSAVLNVMRNGPPGLPRGWYGQVRFDRPCVAPPASGLDCDEYPFYSTQQAGPGASLLVMPRGPNRAQGSRLGTFYDRCTLPELTAFAVIPIPVPGIPTTWLCR